ncbi:MAG: response regulator [Flavobacteriales bacterium]|nr:MAG: response regulator [Flavobacteriales bacterium]
MITSVIVEDSRLARKELLELLKNHPNIAILGEADAAETALQLIKQTKPDLIFLDIHLPGKNGFEILQELDTVPLIIFTTAFDQYALKSFEFNTIDYLLKPISAERLEKAIRKAEATQQKTDTGIEDKLQLTDRIFVKDRNRSWFVTLAEIRIFESQGNYTQIIFDQERPLILKTLQQVSNTVDGRFFLRANRQQLVNVKFISDVAELPGNRLRLTLVTGEKIEVSRRQSGKIRAYYGL